jgi:hypothetical protein
MAAMTISAAQIPTTSLMLNFLKEEKIRILIASV